MEETEMTTNNPKAREALAKTERKDGE